MNRRAAEKRGRAAEAIAALWLMLKGYRIVARRYRSPRGEIDIIARRGRKIAIVEVKARLTAKEALEALGFHQRKRIEKATADWLARTPPGHFSVRFDIIAIVPRRLPAHIMDAWRPGL